MPTTIRAKVRRLLREGKLDDASPLTEVPGIGPYLAGRVRRALRRPAGRRSPSASCASAPRPKRPASSSAFCCARCKTTAATSA